MRRPSLPCVLELNKSDVTGHDWIYDSDYAEGWASVSPSAFQEAAADLMSVSLQRFGEELRKG
jgi:hypothetical protein